MARLPSSTLDRFWLRMAAMFGHTWVSQYGDGPNGVGGDTWAAALAGITPAQIADGLRATLVLSSDWPPSAPRFRAMCLSVPSFTEVVHAIRTEETKPAFARLVWSYIDGFRYRSVDFSKAERMLRDAYDLARDHVMRGGPLPDEPAGAIGREKEKTVPGPAAPPSDPAAIQRVITEVNARLGILTPRTEV